MSADTRIPVAGRVADVERAGCGLVDGGGWDGSVLSAGLFMPAVPRVATVHVVGVDRVLLAARVEESAAEGGWPVGCEDWRYQPTGLPDAVARSLRA